MAYGRFQVEITHRTVNVVFPAPEPRLLIMAGSGSFRRGLTSVFEGFKTPSQVRHWKTKTYNWTKATSAVESRRRAANNKQRPLPWLSSHAQASDSLQTVTPAR